MSDVSDSDPSGAVSSRSEDLKGTNNSMTRIDLLISLLKWIAPAIPSDQVTWFSIRYCFDNFEGETEYQITVKQKLESLLPIFTKSNGDLKFTDEDGKTILHCCILYMRNYKRADNCDKKHDEILVSKLCKWGVSIIANDYKGNSPLKIALMKRRMDLVKTLVHFGYTTSVNNLGQNILHILVSEYSNHKIELEYLKKIIRDLIRKKADFNEPDIDGLTPVHVAAKLLNMKLLKTFEKHGADMHSRTNIGDDLLILVCKNVVRQTSTSKALQLINWLLDQGFNVNSKNNNDFTPLHYASQSHQLDVVKTLVEAGTDLHAVAGGGTNCLDVAAMSDSFEIMGYLIERGAKSNSSDEVYGFTLIHVAALCCNEKNFEWLANNEFNSDHNRHSKFSALHLASMIGNVKVVKKLIEHGADVNSQDKTFHHTALHFASMGGEFEDIEELNATKLNINNFDYKLSLEAFTFTRLRLQKSPETDFESTIFALLEAGANVNAEDIFNCTPLHYTMQQPNSNLIEILLKAGARIDVENNEYLTPLHYSLIENDDQGLKYLLQFGANVNDIEHPHRDFPKDISKSNYAVKYRLIRHLVKLKLANLPFNNVLGEYFHDDTLVIPYNEYSQELEKLKAKMIAPDVSLYDLLRMHIRGRVKFVDSLPSDLKSEFPHYYIIIDGKCNEAIRQNRLIEPAKIAFRTLTQLQWPELCVEHIFMFLNKSALIVLSDICNEVMNTSMRQKKKLREQ